MDVIEGAPSTWVGHALHDVPGVPAELVAAADALRALPPSPASLRIRSVHWADGHAELVLLEALPLRRTLVDVNELLLRTLDVFLTRARNSEVDMHAARRRRGSVSVHSAVGVGTSITLHVPRLDAGSHA